VFSKVSDDNYEHQSKVKRFYRIVNRIRSMRLTIRLFSFKCLDTGPDIQSHRDPIETYEWHALATAQTA
jgi:hypothetical protein